MPLSPEAIITSAAVILIGIISFFLRKIDAKIDETAREAAVLKDKILNIRDELKEDMVEIFNYACHERQNACARLQEVKIGLVEHQAKTCCAKLAALSAEREKKWERQDRMNERFIGHLYKTKDAGAAWNNREDENGGDK
jgi:hypothetical protein